MGEVTRSTRHQVVVIGSGFGGLFGTKALQARRRRRHRDREDQPPSLPAAALPGRDRHPLRGRDRPADARGPGRQHNARVLLGEVTDIDLAARTVTSQVLGRETVTPYDSLIVAAGVGQSYFGNDQFAEFAPGMKSIDDALELRGRIFGAFEIAELGASRGEDVDRLLTFVVVGAGPTGVEMAGQIAELAHRTLKRDFRAINTRTARVVLVDAAGQVLPPFGAKLGAKTKVELEKLGVEVLLGAMVTDVDERGIEVQHKDGRSRADRGGHQDLGRRRAGVVADARRCPSRPAPRSTAPGGSRVNPDLTLPGHPEVFVVGDMIDLDHLPGVAQVAIQGAKYAAKEIERRLAGQAPAEAVPLLRQGLDGHDQPVPRGGDDRQAAAHRLHRLADVARSSTSST